MKGLLDSTDLLHSSLVLLVLVVRISTAVIGSGFITTTIPYTGGSSSYSVPYLADFEPTTEDMMDDNVQQHHDYEQANYPSSSPSTIEQHPQQETDFPLQLSDILPIDRRSYDKMEPPKREGRPTNVLFHVTVLSLDSIDESSMTYAADIFFSQTWQDYRLRFPDNLTAEYRLLPTVWLNSMWRPDSFFKNAKKVTFQDVTIPNHYIWLYKDKSILYMVKLTLILSCSMNFQLYPHDTQQCAMKIESLSHTTNDLVFEWESKTPLVVDDRIELPQLDLVNTVIGDCTQVYSTGNFTCLEVILSFRRRLGYYLFHTYIPTCLIVVMSWISFWIRPEAVPARVTLGVTSLLTLHTQHANSQKALPPVSYIKAIDVFMSGCTVFVFFSLMEYALVNILMGDIIDGEESALKKGMKSMFMTSSGNGGNSGTGSARIQSQQMMEVQPTRCLRNNPPAPTPGSAPSMSRSQSMSVAASCVSAHQHSRCRQHHAAEIHHPDDGLSAVGGHHSSPARGATVQQRGQPLTTQQGGGGANNSLTSRPPAFSSPRQVCRQQLNNAIHLSQQLNAILPSAEDCPAPPPPSPSTVQHRQRNNNGAASENGRLPLISSLHSAGKMPDGGGPSRPGGPRNNQLNNSLNMQQLRRSRAIAVDRISRTGFPLSFFILNVIYWCVYLNSEDPNGSQ